MKISIFGMGYVGVVSGACLLRDGHEIVGIDPVAAKIADLSRGRSPVQEPGVAALLAEGHQAGRLKATTDPEAGLTGSDMAWICVGTPSASDGGVNLAAVETVVRQIGRVLARRWGDADARGEAGGPTPNGAGCHGQGSQTRYTAFGPPKAGQTRLTVLPRVIQPSEEHSQTSLAVAPGEKEVRVAPAPRPPGHAPLLPLIVLRSTCLPGTVHEHVIPWLEEESGLTVGKDVDVVFHPEFLREGSAVEDFLHPPKIVAGEDRPGAADRLLQLYERGDEAPGAWGEGRGGTIQRLRLRGSFRRAVAPGPPTHNSALGTPSDGVSHAPRSTQPIRASQPQPLNASSPPVPRPTSPAPEQRYDAPVFRLSIREAEMVKYWDNLFHALKITFANEIGAVARSAGVDARKVSEVFCADTKLNISPRYLRPGSAFGGSCLPKDLRAILRLASLKSVKTPMLEKILESNDVQINDVVRRILAHRPETVGMVGLAFKAHTDDMRESPYVKIAKALIGEGVRLLIYDPVVQPNRLIGSNKEQVHKALRHLEELLVGSLDDLSAADLILVNHGDVDSKRVQEWTQAGIGVLDAAGIEGVDPQTPGYEGLYW